MKKPTITRTWITGLIILAVGLVIAGISMGLMFGYGGSYTPAASGNGYDFTPRLDSFFWTTVSFMIVGFFIAAVGGVVQITAWIGALVNTYQLQDKTWFGVLLAGGLIGLAFSLVGFAAMVAYVVSGPDSMAAGVARLPEVSAPPTPTPTLASSS